MTAQKKNARKPSKAPSPDAAKAKPAIAADIIAAAAAPVAVAPLLPPRPPAAPPAKGAVPLDSAEALASYKDLYDTLGRAYWEASDLHSKDTIQGAREAVYEILTGLNRAKLQANTAAYQALLPSVEHANKALEQIKAEIGTITKNITTAASVITGITRVLDIVAMF
jgi:hypothetical protein